MGKGRVITAHGEGRYTIELLEDRARVNAARALAVARVADLDARIIDLEADLAQAQTVVDTAADTQDQAIAAYQAAVDAGDAEAVATLRQAMTDASKAVVEAAAKRDAIAGHIRAMKVQRLAAQRRIDLIDALPPLRQQEAWCADFTEDLEGEVATAEVPGEVGQVLVRPAYSGGETAAWPVGIQGGAVWTPARDGAIQPALSGTPASVFYNLAMTPGWQRWRPTFRLATITAISADLCDITLDAATSSQQGLDVNAQASYTGVPIYYMECNGAVFEVGDRVLVAFSGNTEAPMVVGFESEPRLCGPIYSTTMAMPTRTADQQRQHHKWAFGPSGNLCGGATVTVDNDPVFPEIQVGLHGNDLFNFTNDLPATNSATQEGNLETSARHWQFDGTSNVVVRDWTASASTFEAIYEETTTFEMKYGPALATDFVLTIHHSTDAACNMECVPPDGTWPGAIYPVQIRNLITSSITVDGSTLDLGTLGLRVVGANFTRVANRQFTASQDDYFTVNARTMTSIDLSRHDAFAEKDGRQVVYIEANVLTIEDDYVVSKDGSMEDVEVAAKSRKAAWMKAPDGSLFRVQARATDPANQMPDYASLPVDIEQTEVGTWVAVY